MYENKYSVGYEVLSKSKGYSIGSAGDISSNATYLIANDFPEYAGMFYSPTQHEIISSIKYGKIAPGYDSEAREIQESLQGIPLEFYIPKSMPVNEGVGRREIKPLAHLDRKINKKVIDEIKKAQKEIMGKEIILRKIENIVVMRKTKISEVILRSNRKDI